MIQYGGYGVSAGRKYYHARKQANETPLEYLYRLNVAAIRAKIAIREGEPAARREHVEHFIDTLDDRDLAKQLTLLRLDDADVCVPISVWRNIKKIIDGINQIPPAICWTRSSIIETDLRGEGDPH